ncbi:MAG: DUF2442 domain-containing protein [Bryobacteraceae bacterium]|nr:DUF2442 domain-containing protein [Bryobacteraceae bacterium]
MRIHASCRSRDGRTIIVPLVWYPRLLSAPAWSSAPIGRSQVPGGIHWPELDEDLSTEGLLHGAPAADERLRQPASYRTRLE